jgi:hypothetical protein
VSLNDCLEAGPSLIPLLPEVLLRFRRWQFALTADISKAFLQISLKEEDRDVHRFLLREGDVIRRMRFCRVTFGVTSSPFLLNATIRHHLALFPETKAVVELKNNLYVDDWLTGADSEQEVVEMFAEAQSVMDKAQMTLTKWNSNSKMVCDKVGAVMSESAHTKILGVVWLPGEDSFSFEGTSLPQDVVPTKRVILSFLARLFDPIGFLTPYSLVAKCLFQELWTLGVQWDEEIPPDLQERFHSWLNGLEALKLWKIPRQFVRAPWCDIAQSGVHLHVFSDASERGYGAVSYLCATSAEGVLSSSLIMARAKVAPLKKVTIPRLELLGCLLAARLLKFVRDALQLDSLSYSCWTDSTVALAWIKGDPSRWKQFVANRVREIHELSDPARWNHCPGKENPADLASRGVLAEDLIEADIWLSGPPWLANPPEGCVGDYPEEEIVESECKSGTVILVCPNLQPEEVYQFKRWGSLVKTLRIVAWVRRFLQNCRFPKELVSGPLSYSELSEAKVEVFKQVQRFAFPEEYACLSRDKPVSKGSSIRKLNPFLDDAGLMRVKGRLQLSELSYEEKHPLILPRGHVASLLVSQQHLIMKHAGVDSVVTALRATYWIIGLRRLVKSIKRECYACQRADARACQEPPAPLPSLRVSEASPFTVTGVDYAGPLFCSDFPSQKFYVCLFTCAVVRAIHLELTDSLSTEGFLLALRRFASRRGLPSVIYSDNAQTFKAAESNLSAYFGSLCPEWKWIVPRAPWWGGWWERLVRSVKVSLRKTIGGRSLTRVELETTLQEIEACINSRPLSFVGDDIDNRNPLTPNHFLTGKGVGFQARVIEDLDAVTPGVLSEKESRRTLMLDKFWSVWQGEYLRNLPSGTSKFASRGPLEVGSVVLIREDWLPRMQWEVGIVKEVYPGKDKVVRSVKLHTKKGDKVRAIQRLHSLELVSPEPQAKDNNAAIGNVVTPSEENKIVTPATQRSVPEPNPVRTRFGREIKPIDRLNI